MWNNRARPAGTILRAVHVQPQQQEAAPARLLGDRPDDLAEQPRACRGQVGTGQPRAGGRQIHGGSRPRNDGERRAGGHPHAAEHRPDQAERYWRSAGSMRTSSASTSACLARPACRASPKGTRPLIPPVIEMKAPGDGPVARRSGCPDPVRLP
jgi:hypothetical protein